MSIFCYLPLPEVIHNLSILSCDELFDWSFRVPLYYCSLRTVAGRIVRVCAVEFMLAAAAKTREEFLAAYAARCCSFAAQFGGFIAVSHSCE